MAPPSTQDPSKDIKAIFRHHETETWHLCKACGAQYSNREDLVDHMSCHAYSEARECTITKAVVKSRTAGDKSVVWSKKFLIIAHEWKLKKVDESKYWDFGSESDLNSNDKKSYACKDCGKTYKDRLQLEIHEFCKRSYGTGCDEADPPLVRGLHSTFSSAESETELRSSRSIHPTSKLEEVLPANPPSGNSLTGEKIYRFGTAPVARKKAAFVPESTRATRLTPVTRPKQKKKPKSQCEHRSGSCTCVMCEQDPDLFAGDAELERSPELPRRPETRASTAAKRRPVKRKLLSK